MPPPPQDSPQTELAPRKRRRKRDDPQNCLTNSEEFDSDDASPLSCSDVESFQGKIVYNPDGSAYIIDSENESLSNISSADNCASEGVHLPVTPNNPKIHSFRVVSASDAQCLIPSSGTVDSTVTQLSSGSSAGNNLDAKTASSAAKITKPILMCFICKLSFGNTKSFGLHASTEHTLNLQENEKNLLNREYSSAIIQRNIDEKPQISFLQPLGSTQPQKDTQSKSHTINSDADDLSAQHLHHSTDLIDERKQRRNNLSDSTELSSSVESLIEDKQKQQPQLTSSPLITPHSQSQSRQLFDESPLKSNNNSLVGMSVSTASVASKTLNDLISQQQQQQRLTSSLLAPFLQQQQLNQLRQAAQSGCPEHPNGKGVDCKTCELLECSFYGIGTDSIRLPRTPSKSPNGNGNITDYSQQPAQKREPASTSPPDTIPLTISPTSQPAPSFTIGACPEHVNGRPFGVDCSRCELILNSARLNTGAQISTRNSCKTLKCPQCNWHYKYQETLEIHMREKHPDGESACGYCLAGQQHPRLARGESYTCGYKPYRCDICNYSTTTKGNLSIHMQSDKHLNNMQELSNSQNLNNNSSLSANVPSGTTNSGAGDIRDSPKILLPNLQQQQNQQNQQQTQQQQQAQQQQLAAAQNLSNSNKPKASFRCGVCSYETSVARNLRIHWTSEKHTHNMAVLENNIKHLQALGFLQQQSHAAAGLSTGLPQLPALPSLTLQQQQQQQQQQHLAVAQNLSNLSNMQSFLPEAALADLAYNQALVFQLLNHRNPSAAALTAAQNPLANTNANATNVNAPLLNPNGNGLSPISSSNNSNTTAAAAAGAISSAGLESDFGLNPDSFEPPIETDLYPTTMYSCLICANFNTNQIEELNQHLLIDRSRQNQQDVMLIINETNKSQHQPTYVCRLCNYRTTLKANFQLHSKTDKHIQKLNYINHIKEGGTSNEYKINYNSNNTVQLKCNCCDYYTNSIQKLNLHSQNMRHESMKIIFNHLVSTMVTVSSSSLSNDNNDAKTSIDTPKNVANDDAHDSIDKLNESSENVDAIGSTDNATTDQHQSNDGETQQNEETENATNQTISVKSSDEINDTAKDSAIGITAISVKSTDDLIDTSTKENTDNNNSASSQTQLATTNNNNDNNSNNNNKVIMCQLCNFKANHILGMVQHVKSFQHMQIEHLICMQRAKENLDSLELTDVFTITESDCGSGEGNTRQMFSGEGSMTGATSTNIYKCNHCDYLTENKFDIVQHMSAMHPQCNDTDFQTISSSNANARWSSDEMNLLSGAGRTNISTPTPTEKEDDIKSERMDAENSEDDFNMGANDGTENVDGTNEFTAVCPLCQDSFGDKKSLENHVMNIHHVNTDGLARLLNLYETSHWLNSNNGSSSSSITGTASMMQAAAAAVTNKIGKSPGSSASSCADNSDIECVTCGTSLKSMSELFMHANESQHFQLTGSDNEYMCLLRVCQQQFASINGMLSHFKDCHMNAVISERHVYKFRCKLCSLAFKTQEKLNQHLKYHTMREATRCHLCSRNFRSLASLQKHMEQFHQGNTSSPITSPNLDKSNEYDDYPIAGSPENEMIEIQRSNSVAADDQSSVSTEMISETTDLDEYLNSQTMAEEGYNDLMRKFKCNKCKMGFTHQTYLQQHYKSNLHHRRNAEKTSNYSFEKYNDPKRPFKCETCRESFTQNNILQVHFNSVSHLHKKKQIESITPSTSPTIAATNASSSGVEFDRRSVDFDRKSVDFDRKSFEFNEIEGEAQKRKCSPDNDYDSPKKKFKCDICKVAYAQGSTLDIHMRSVLHQTRACKEQQQLQQQLQQRQQFSPSNSQFSAVSPTPSNMSGTGNVDLNESTVNALKASNSPKFNNQIYKMLLENYGSDMVKQFIEMNKNPSGETAQRLAANPALANFLLNEAALNANANLAQSLNASLNTSSNAEKYFCRHCKKTFSSVFVLKSHCEEVHNEKVPVEFLEKFAEKFKDFYMESGNASNDGPDNEILDFSKKNAADFTKVKTETNLSQPLAASSPALGKLAEQSQQALQLEHLSQQLNIDPATLAQKIMEQNLAAAANFPQFGIPGGLQGLQSLQHLQNLPGLPALGGLQGLQSLQNLQNLPNLAGNPQLNTLDMLNLMQFQNLLSLNFMNLAPPLIFGAAAAAQQANTNNEAGLNIAPNLGRSTASMSSVSSNASDIAVNANPLAAAQKVQLLQQQAAAAQQQATSNQKRARTRITDEQLKILRAHFDINNSPSEESILEMSKKANLPMKVVKHWFRNTLFKERQRNKDSPYNFNNPPSTTLNLEEYERTGQAKVTSLGNELSNSLQQQQTGKGYQQNHNAQSNQNDSRPHSQPSSIASTDRSDYAQAIKSEPNDLDESPFHHHNLALAAAAAVAAQQRHLQQQQQQHKQSQQKNSVDHHHQNLMDQDGNNMHMYFETKSESGSEILSRPPTPNSTSYSINDMINQQIESIPINNIANISGGGGSQNDSNNREMGPPKKFQLNKMFEKNFDANSNSSNSSTSSGKRANRTRFTDYQIKVLQEFFENNSYPKDSDLEYLSKLLLLSPRVIVVWFQNARQKQRKIYENQPNQSYCETEEKKSNINYNCKKCNLVFQRYYELIRHQKNHCFKEENNKKSAKAQIAAAQISLEQQQQMQQQNMSSEDSSSSMDVNNSISGSNVQHQSEQQNTLGGTLFGGVGGGFGNSQQLLGQGFGDTTPFNLLQNMAAVGASSASALLDNSVDLSHKKRKLSESSDNELNDFKTLNKKYKGDQFEFLYNYYMQNEQNDELKKQDKNVMDFDFLFQYYQMNELKKKGGNFDYLYQYYLQNEKNQKQLGSPTLHSKSPGLDPFGGDKPSFDYLLQYYQVNESKKFLQDSASQLQEPKADINQTTAIMKQMLSLIQKQQRSVAALQSNPHFKSQTNEQQQQQQQQQQRPTSVSLASTASMESLNEQNSDVFNANTSGLSSGRSPDRSASGTAATTEKQSNKRLRTTILPEQLNFLYECYQNESNPSRKMLEEISKKVNLKKRVVQVWFQNARAKDKKSRNSRCYTDDDSLHQSSSVASPDLQLDDCKICGIQKINLQEHVYSREHLAQVKTLLENGGINCLTDQMSATFDKSPSVTPTPQQQLQQTNPSFITGLYNQYILQQNNSQQQFNSKTEVASAAAAAAANGAGSIADEGGENKKLDDLHSNQPSTSPMENNLTLQINADKQSSTSATTNNEILQQLYNYSQMSGELIK